MTSHETQDLLTDTERVGYEFVVAREMVMSGMRRGLVLKNEWQEYLSKFHNMHFSEDALYPIVSSETANRTISTELRCLFGDITPINNADVAAHTEAYLTCEPPMTLDQATVRTLDDVATYALVAFAKA